MCIFAREKLVPKPWGHPIYMWKNILAVDNGDEGINIFSSITKSKWFLPKMYSDKDMVKTYPRNHEILYSYKKDNLLPNETIIYYKGDKVLSFEQVAEIFQFQHRIDEGFLHGFSSLDNALNDVKHLNLSGRIFYIIVRYKCIGFTVIGDYNGNLDSVASTILQYDGICGYVSDYDTDAMKRFRINLKKEKVENEDNEK
jgi:hypothetical protein